MIPRSSASSLVKSYENVIDVIWPTCIERRLEPLLERDNRGGRRLVAPRPANKLFNNDGDLAHINAWNDDTVKTPNLFNMFFVGRDTCVSSDWNEKKENFYIYIKA